MITSQIKNVLSPHSQGPWPLKRGRVLNQDEGAPPKKSRGTSIVWLREVKNIFPQPQGSRDVKAKLVLAKPKHKNAN